MHFGVVDLLPSPIAQYPDFCSLSLRFSPLSFMLRVRQLQGKHGIFERCRQGVSKQILRQLPEDRVQICASYK